MITVKSIPESDGKTGCTRRSFLGGATALALGACSPAAAFAVPRQARYRLAIAGSPADLMCEVSGRDDHLNACGIEVAAVTGRGADPTAGATEKAIPAFTDYRRMLELVRPDLLWIGAAAGDRPGMAIVAARHGVRGICVEPPLYPMRRELGEMAAECRRYGAKVMVFHPLDYGRQLPLVRSVVADGGLGRVREIRVWGTFDDDCPQQRLWRTAEELLVLLRFLGGEPQSCLGRAYSAGRTVRTVSDSPDMDAFHATYAVPGAVMAHLDLVRRSKARNSSGATISGSRGVLELETTPVAAARLLAEPPWSRGRSHRLAVPVATTQSWEPEDGQELSRVWALRDLVASIEEDCEPTGSVAAAGAAAEMLAAAIRSQQRGSAIPLHFVHVS